MHITGANKVKDQDGVWGTVVPASPHLFSNAAQVVVQTESGLQILVPTDMLVQQPDGSYYLPLRLAELEGYLLKAGQLEYDCRYSKMHGIPVTGGRGFRSLKPLWYNGVPPYVGTRA